MKFYKTFESFSDKVKVLYHGSNNRFETFNPKHLGSNMGRTPSNLSGFFFSDNKEVAESFGKFVYTCSVSLNNPKTIDAKGKDYSQYKHYLNDYIEKLDKTKYDSLIVKNYIDSFHDDPIMATQYIVFDARFINVLDIEENEKTFESYSSAPLKDMEAFGLSKYDIDSDGYVTLYHGGKKLPDVLNKDEIFFMTVSEDEAKDYANIRGGHVFTIKVKPEDVNWNQGSYEVEFSKGGVIKNGKIYPNTEIKINKAKNTFKVDDPWTTKKDNRQLSEYKGVKIGDTLPKSNWVVLDIIQHKGGIVQFEFKNGWYNADAIINYEFK